MIAHVRLRLFAGWPNPGRGQIEFTRATRRASIGVKPSRRAFR